MHIRSAAIRVIRGAEHLSITRTRHSLRLSFFSVLSVPRWLNRLWRVQIRPRRSGNVFSFTGDSCNIPDTENTEKRIRFDPVQSPRQQVLRPLNRVQHLRHVPAGSAGCHGQTCLPVSCPLARAPSNKFEGGTQWSKHLRVTRRSHSLRLIAAKLIRHVLQSPPQDGRKDVATGASPWSRSKTTFPAPARRRQGRTAPHVSHLCRPLAGAVRAIAPLLPDGLSRARR